MDDYENSRSLSEEIGTIDNKFLEKANHAFAQPCAFVTGAAKDSQLPDSDLYEFAFIGRSNVGKSSLINAVLNRKNLVKTSKTPGRTQQINFFNLADILMLVDLPGYGYAKVSKSRVYEWTQLMVQYLRGRRQLKRVFVLVDARHGLKPSDEEMLAILDESAVSYRIILTKADKVNRTEQDHVISKVLAAIKFHPAAHPEIILTSAEKKYGLDQLRIEILRLI